MSGGHFDYNQFRIDEIADDIDKLILSNNIPGEFGYCNDYSDNTIEVFRNASLQLRKAAIMAHRIDYLVSGDDGEERFHNRLIEDLEKLYVQ